MNNTLAKSEQKKVRVLIADDHQIVRMGLRSLLDIHPQIDVVGEAGTGHETLSLVTQLQLDVVLLDFRMPDLDGLEICGRIKAQSPATAVLFLTSFADDQTILGAIEAGADGYLLKSLAGQNIPASILTVASGGSALDPEVTRRVLNSVQRPKATDSHAREEARMDRLTVQEGKVLELVALGRSNKQIAQELRLSEGTVRNY